MAVDAAARGLPRARRSWLGADAVTPFAVAAVAVLLVGLTKADHLAPTPWIARGAIASLALFLVTGEALARAVAPHDLGVPRVLLALPLGAAASGLVLTALGFAHVPLRVSLWLTLAVGLAASAIVRRRARATRSPAAVVERLGERRLLWSWLAVLLVLFCVAMIPSWRTNSITVYGNNPDAHQVTGIAVLLQHAPPTATDDSLPIDTVPRQWRFRYPIFYALAGASNLSHFDPIRVFPAMAAVLLIIAALGSGAFAVACLGAPARAGPALAAATGLSVISLHLAWHPYWNQLWGLALLPYALLFGWRAVEALDIGSALLLLLVLVTAALAYPLALPYPLVIVAALAVAYRRRPRPVRLARSHRWWVALLAAAVLAPALVGAALKLGQGIDQIFSTGSALWGGDVPKFLPVGRFVGTGGGVLPALAVAALAAIALVGLPRRLAIVFGGTVILLCMLDARFRLTSSGGYMDFKHLSFMGALVVTLAGVTVARMVSTRRPALVLAGVGVILAWSAAAIVQDRREILGTEEQVPETMFQIRDWARSLPKGASVRVDIPPTGLQLWAIYMLGGHPVDAPAPVLSTTYAHAKRGLRAEYALSLHYFPTRDQRHRHRVPPYLFAQDPPVRENDQFALRRIAWPARYAWVPDTSSTALVEP